MDYRDNKLTILTGDCLNRLRDLPEKSVQTVVTSPPYFGLRDYVTNGQLGQETRPADFVAALVAVFREVRRVLRDDGTVWLNLGDSYAVNGGARAYGSTDAAVGRASAPGKPRRAPEGYKNKDLLGIPWQVAFALRDDGWYLRSDIIWASPNPVPESVKDRPTSAHEYVFLLTKKERYYYDAEAVKEASKDLSARKAGVSLPPRNRRDVWEIAMQPYKGAHFACVDDQTEALTPVGWKRHENLTDGDLIAVWTENKINWQPATFHRYDFEGNLIAIEKRDSSQRLTPDHRCMIRMSRSGIVKVLEAQYLKPSMEILTAATWNVSKKPGVGEDWAALIGWYVTEGHISKTSNTVIIYQSENANPHHVVTIRSLLRKVGAIFKERRRVRSWRGRPSIEIEFIIKDQIAQRLKSEAPEKHLLPKILDWPEKERWALLNAMIDGDGHRRIDKRRSITQKNKADIEMMQILALSLGLRAIISRRVSDGIYVVYLTEGEWLTLAGTDRKTSSISQEYYKGIVWCPSVSSGFWLARRNGRPFITGNTFPPSLVEPCILAGTSARGSCPDCGMPWQRVISRVAGPTPTADWTETLGWRPACFHYERVDEWVALPKQAKTESDKVYQKRIAPLVKIRAELLKSWESAPTIPCVVLDPFGGAGTTALVANRYGRTAVLIELNPEYAQLALSRLGRVIS